LGDAPLMTTNTKTWTSGVGGDVIVENVQHGMTEIQTVTTAAEDAYDREVQTITTSANVGQTLSGTFSLAYNNIVTTAISATATAADVKTTLELLTDINEVNVERYDNAGGAASADYVWRVTFIDPVGDALMLVADGSSLVGTGKEIGITEIKKGYAPLGGTFILNYKPVTQSYHYCAYLSFIK
jgi:hypothetical protein